MPETIPEDHTGLKYSGSGSFSVSQLVCRTPCQADTGEFGFISAKLYNLCAELGFVEHLAQGSGKA